MPAFSHVPSAATRNLTVNSTTYVAFDSLYVSTCTIVNNTGVDLNVRVRTSPSTVGTPMLVKDGTFFEKDGITNLNQIEVARAGGSGDVTVQAEVN